jgi:uncharacterized protein (TIGR00299 family) protein
VTVLYFDCFSGAAGDMILGALIDAGAPQNDVRKALESLGIEGWTLTVKEVRRAGLRAKHADVAIELPEPPRTYPDIVSIIEHAPLSETVMSRSLETFRVMAEAEAAVHGVPPDRVHLHEVGMTDALVDVVGSSAAIEYFRPSLIACSPIATGTGWVRTDDGELPLPAPAVAELLRGAPLYGTSSSELVTPTGAAILRSACDIFGALPPMTVEHIGYGAGTRDSERPNVLRVLIGDDVADPQTALLIETNIDDSTPEALAFVVERLLESGAHDAWATPIVMKKGRSAVTLSVLCDPAARSRLEEILFAETTTIGTRAAFSTRRVLPRETVTVMVLGHDVRVKVARSGGRVVTVAPEFEDARAAARATGKPLKEIYALAIRAAENRVE